MANRSLKKSKAVYEEIESSGGFYCSLVEKNCRSRMNIPFRIGGPAGNDDLEKQFLKEAETIKMVQLKGHRSVGGIRASLYNAITEQETDVLVNFMREFRAKHKN